MREERGVSSVLGVVMILGITLAAMTSIMVIGGLALQESQDDAELSRMETSMAQMSSKASLVALGDAEVQRFNLGDVNDGSVNVVENEGTISLNHTEDPSGPKSSKLGTLVYKKGDSEIAYQGGGVWRYENGESSMVSPPEFHYRDGTLTLPIIMIAGEGGSSDSFSGNIERESNPSIRDWRDMENGSMVMTVETRYCGGWESYFEDRTESAVIEGCDAGEENRVKTEFEMPEMFDTPFEYTVFTGTINDRLYNNVIEGDIYVDGIVKHDIIDTRIDGSLLMRNLQGEIENTTINDSLYVGGHFNEKIIDSEISGDIHVGGQLQGEVRRSNIDGTVFVGGNLDNPISDTRIDGNLHVQGQFQGNMDESHVSGGLYVDGDLNNPIEDSVIEGDLHVGGNLQSNLSGTNISGDVYLSGPENGHLSDSDVGGNVHEHASNSVEDPLEPTPLPEPNRDEFPEPEEPDSTDTDELPDCFENGQIDGDCEVNPGSYYVDSLMVTEDGELNLNVTEGDLVINVGGDIDIHGSVRAIENESGNKVTFRGGGEVTFEDAGSLEVINPLVGSGATSVQMDLTDSGQPDISLGGDSDPGIAAVINAGEHYSTTVDTTFFGAISLSDHSGKGNNPQDEVYIEPGAEVYFSEGLLEDGELGYVTGPDALYFLHVTENRVEINLD